MVVDLYDLVINPQWNKPLSWLLLTVGIQYRDPLHPDVDDPYLWRVLVFHGRRRVRLSRRKAVVHELYPYYRDAVQRAKAIRSGLLAGQPLSAFTDPE